MATQPIYQYRKLVTKNNSHEGSCPKEDDVDTLPSPRFLQCLVICFIIYMYKKERHKNEKMIENETMKTKYKQAQDQLRKENDQLMKENVSQTYECISFQMRGKLNLGRTGRRHHCTLTGRKNFSRL
ncbi:uncharacterized protein LOC117020324 isoform X4 [Rhinolophus ferrumequinum]|uniref:uncharacterized protein LOC117020324 isoform X4 n=1 Tax=Rhinolophus ferrumequinum TaxID=59479 RepID=UPI00140F7924|nr:uncharacterized protein LOC117020324 isoform X4 [Rhinolophus ferrumequinum]